MPKILIVDDEEMVVRVICAALNSGGHEIEIAKSGKEALAFAQAADAIDLLIIDHSLPPDRGPEIANRILLRHPAMRILHISGYLRYQVEAEESLAAQAGFIQKPFTVKQIKDAVDSILGNDSSISEGMRESIEHIQRAVRVLTSLTENRSPDPDDVAELRRFAPKAANKTIDELVCDAIRKVLEHCNVVSGEPLGSV